MNLSNIKDLSPDQLITKMNEAHAILRKEPLVRETLEHSAANLMRLAKLTQEVQLEEGALVASKALMIGAALEFAFHVHTLHMLADVKETTDFAESYGIDNRVLPLVLTCVLFWKQNENKLYQHPMFPVALMLASTKAAI